MGSAVSPWVISALREVFLIDHKKEFGKVGQHATATDNYIELLKKYKVWSIEKCHTWVFIGKSKGVRNKCTFCQ